MEESPSFLATRRYAVVTGANKGIGFEICRQLASKGVAVVLTSRDEMRGREALRKLKEESSPDLPGEVIFHQLDVTDSKSTDALAAFIEAQFGKLDILVNNAGVGGCIIDAEAIRAASFERLKEEWGRIATESYELSEECLDVNYYGAKRMVDALIHLLQLSDSPRIVNVSSVVGKLEIIPSGWAKEVLSNVETLTEDKLDEVLKKFLKDFKEGSLDINGWPVNPSVYAVSKAALNAYTRILARKYPSICINCVCPGFVKTDINLGVGCITAEETAEAPVWLALLTKRSASGHFFVLNEESSF